MKKLIIKILNGYSPKNVVNTEIRNHSSKLTYKLICIDFNKNHGTTTKEPPKMTSYLKARLQSIVITSKLLGVMLNNGN